MMIHLETKNASGIAAFWHLIFKSFLAYFKNFKNQKLEIACYYSAFCSLKSIR